MKTVAQLAEEIAAAANKILADEYGAPESGKAYSGKEQIFFLVAFTEDGANGSCLEYGRASVIFRLDTLTAKLDKIYAEAPIKRETK